MNRKPLLWMLACLLLVAFYGCRTKKPQTAEESVVAPAAAATPPPPTTAAPPPVATADDRVEDPLQWSDLQALTDELRRRGFSTDVYFAFDEDVLSDEAREKLVRNADLLRGVPQLQVIVEGHADERGTNEYNLALGERRAYRTRDYLAAQGLSDDRLRVISYGEERPLCTESEESCWSQNRRAHMIVTVRGGG